MSHTIKTVLHRYDFNIEKEQERQAYEELCKKLDDGRHFFNVLHIPGKSQGCPEGEVELETEHLFSDQWNTKGVGDHSGYRVFDWYEAIYSNKYLKEGHYLIITDEMREIRRNTLVCGYCANQEPAQKGYVFCYKCLGSAYLKESDLHLLRMLPVEKFIPKRKKLTKAEREHLLPQYIEAQTKRRASDAVKLRAKIEKERKEKIDEINTKTDGLLWCLDNDINIDNLIYYGHKNQFCFGWQQEVSQKVADELRRKLQDFPYPVMIKCAEGQDWKQG